MEILIIILIVFIHVIRGRITLASILLSLACIAFGVGMVLFCRW